MTHEFLVQRPRQNPRGGGKPFELLWGSFINLQSINVHLHQPEYNTKLNQYAAQYLAVQELNLQQYNTQKIAFPAIQIFLDFRTSKLMKNLLIFVATEAIFQYIKS